MKLASYARDSWTFSGNGTVADGLIELRSAIDGHVVAVASRGGVDVAEMVRYARSTGGPNIRRLTFRERADMLRALAAYLNEKKPSLYDLSFETGATRGDNFFDIDGGIGTLFSYASRGRREMPDERFALDGPLEPLSKGGTFVGRHVMTPLYGVAVHVNAFNFPCWGMLEKLSPAILAGMPVIVKPATPTAYVAHAVFRCIVESGILPAGSVQMIVGSVGDLLDHLNGQDVISFTGSADTSLLLRNHAVVAQNSVRFIAERDSLNAAVLGKDARPGTPEFDLFIREVAREMTVKCGQKCTAIRRALVPAEFLEPAEAALVERLGQVVVGNPRLESVRMGALAGQPQRSEVRARIAELSSEAVVAYGDPEHCTVTGADDQHGAFLSPILLRCENPQNATKVHGVEAFGPVATLMPYEDTEDAIAIARRGSGSLVASVYSYDDAIANELILGMAPYHGRIIVIDRDCAKESTGHGSPLPPLVHGGPGRAGGGEELGGLRGVFHYMQRTALQGSPGRLSSVTRCWLNGAPEKETGVHPFRRSFDELEVGETIHTPPRTVSLDDIEHFARFTGDQFYAHMDEEAAKANPFFPGRVAHGYLILSFAAGLFVDPAVGPVLANYGLDGLRFLKPVSPGDEIRVRLTVKQKTPRKPEYGEVRWDVEVTNRDGEVVATYDLLTMNARAHASA
ncbi:MAG: phenylacetic acid degradation bifunctional protein PaaZ [Candidatus Eremiobacteraeota bacterium]|nr:phenylacetic acid degradation bifunctional protein PaaZ [Candidatus Eremiobacteraeota bacterium]